MPVEAVARNEVVVVPLFDDVPVVENDDLVRVGDGPQAMCDDDHRLARAEGSDCSLDERFVLRVERSRGFVKEDHGGVFQEGARDGEALALPSGQSGAVLAVNLNLPRIR